MMSEEKLFEEYMEEKKGGLAEFFKSPKGWMVVFIVIVGIILLVLFYKSAILDVMSGEEVRESVQVVWHDTQWADKEVTPQEVKIVPSIRLKIKNIGKRPLQYMDIQAVFLLEETGATFSDGLVRIFKEPLQPGETSEEITIKALYGYSATSRAAFMENKEEWKKMQAKIFARAKGSSLVPIGEVYPVKQVIEGFDPESDTGEKKPEEYPDEATAQLAHSIRIVQQDSLWVDKIVTPTGVIIVPSITVEIKNLGEKELQHIYIKGIFKYDDTGEILSEGVTPALEKPLAPGETSKEITVKADFGYSASSKKAFYMNNKKWKQLKVRLYAKSKGSSYALLGTFPIKQKIQGVKVIYQ
jgi:hypothetical protein